MKSILRMLQIRGLSLRIGWHKTFLTFKLRTCSGGSKIVARAYKSALWEWTIVYTWIDHPCLGRVLKGQVGRDLALSLGLQSSSLDNLSV